MKYPKRLIEVDLPIARISAHARREKSIRHGHISTLHIWWARRPLAACRAVICAALWPDPADPLCPPSFREATAITLQAFARRVNPARISAEGRQLQDTLSDESRVRYESLSNGTLSLSPSEPEDMLLLRMALLDFIADFSNWDNSTLPAYLEASRALTQAAHESLGGIPGTRPFVADPFCGGGSIPLEALRVGADAFASDLNPVPVLLNKVVLEYIPKFGNTSVKSRNAVGGEVTFDGLADAVRYWGDWIKDQAEKSLAGFYPKDPDGATPIAYFWARTIRCEGPACGVTIPMMNQEWIKKKGKPTYAFRLTPSSDRSSVDITIVENPPPKEVGNGTAGQGAVTCPVCGFTNAAKRVRERGRTAGIGTRPIGVVLSIPGSKNRRFRTLNLTDLEALDAAEKAAANIDDEFTRAFDAQIPRTELRRVSVPLYGLVKFHDLLLPRQKLALATLSRELRRAYESVSSSPDPGVSLIALDVVALGISNVLHYNMNLSTYLSNGMISAFIQGTSLAMRSDFAEANPLMDTLVGGLDYSFTQIDRMLQQSASCKLTSGSAERFSATSIGLPDDSVSLVATDPPYYDSVPYSHLSDIFYLWLKSCLGSRYATYFKDSVIPKSEEIVEDRSHSQSPSVKRSDFFEAEMMRAMRETRRIVAPHQIQIVVFAHKSTLGWEAMLHALIEAGWTVVAAWPIDTERSARMNAFQNASLLSSIHVVCRPREDANGELTNSVGEWRDVLGELPIRIHEWMPRLAAEGVVGADAIFACLGPALEIFSRYSRVEKANGETATLHEYLEHVWAAVSTEALSLIFKDANGTGLEPDARLTAMWLWTLGGASKNGKELTTSNDDQETEDNEDENESGPTGRNKISGGFFLEYDAARKIAQGLGVHLEQSESLVEVKGDKARLLPVSERTQFLFGKGHKGNESVGSGKKKVKQKMLFDQLDEVDAAESGWTDLKGPEAGNTVLDRVHQSMILFAANRGEMLKRFLVDDGVGKDERFWKLADNLNKLYPTGTDERRWVEGVLARKKGLGL